MSDRRDEIRADLAELFAERRRARGLAYATWRLALDVLSLTIPRRPTGITGDLRYALRLFRRHAGMIGITVAGLGLAIGVTTSIFTILNASVLRPFGVEDPASVVRVLRTTKTGMSTTWPYSAFVTLRDQPGTTRVEAALREQAPFGTVASPQNTPTIALDYVSGDYLEMLGARTIIGRTLTPADDRPDAAPAAVLHHEFWRRAFGGDREVIGRTAWLNGVAVAIVGVTAPSFSGPGDRPPALWMPFSMYGAVYHAAPVARDSDIAIDIVGRVAAGTSRAAAEAQLSTVASRLPPIGNGLWGETPVPVAGVRLEGAGSRLDGPDATPTLIIVSIVCVMLALVLALACMNVANLLLAGAATRAREIAVRLALGATRRRIARQLLGESVLIGTAAGASGLLLSLWLVPLLARLTALPPTYDLSPDGTVLAFVTAVALACGLGAGLSPARFGARSDLAGVMKDHGPESRGASRTRRWFLGLQAAASTVLLVVAALLARTAWHVSHLPLGFDAERLVVTTPAFPQTAFSAEDATEYWRRAQAVVRTVPGVEQVSLSLHTPFGGSLTVSQLTRNGRPYSVYQFRTDADYFATAGLRIVRGRAYTAAEVAANAPVALVSADLVREIAGGVDPIGAPLSTITGSAGVTIIGVVAEGFTNRTRDEGRGTIYRPISASSTRAASLLVRSTRAEIVGADIDAALGAFDPRVRSTTHPVRTDVDRYMGEYRLLATLAGGVATLALVLAVLGIYGVTAFEVQRRAREVSVRMAIGASASRVVGLLVRQSLSPVAIGTAVGLALALSASRLLAGVLLGISPRDPAAIAGTVGIVAVTVTAAVIGPARRAARADPAGVLRG